MAALSPHLRRLYLRRTPLPRIQHKTAFHTTALPAAFQPILIPALTFPTVTSAFANLQSFLSSLWDSFLLAVPKKKTSYSKKRSRQLAGKALKDVRNLKVCSSCGRVKRSHVLCSYCVALIKSFGKYR